MSNLPVHPNSTFLFSLFMLDTPFHFTLLTQASHTDLFCVSLTVYVYASLSHSIAFLTNLASQDFISVHFGVFFFFMSVSIHLSVVLYSPPLPVLVVSSAFLFPVHRRSPAFSRSPSKPHLCPHPLRSRASLRHRLHLSALQQCVLVRSASA